jgi:hypothetical protein
LKEKKNFSAAIFLSFDKVSLLIGLKFTPTHILSQAGVLFKSYESKKEN